MARTIADFITDDLRSRIASGAPLPGNLTLAALSQHYQVSTTPVRLAVGRLLDQQYLERQTGNRLRVNPLRVPDSPAPNLEPDHAPTPPPNIDDWEAALTEEIIRKSLRRESDYLREEATSARLGLGRTVVRGLFSRLAGKGLLEHLPRRGWRIRPIDVSDLDAYLQVREALELKALDLALDRLDPDDLNRMLLGNLRASGSLNNEIHQYLIDRSHNPYIRDFFQLHGLSYRLLLEFAAPETRNVESMARQHRAILRALLDRDWPRARRALARHIRAQRPLVHRLLDLISRNSAAG